MVMRSEKAAKTAIITGATGQDGAYLAKLLLGKGYNVIATYRRTSSVNFWRMEELGITDHERLHLAEYDLTDPGANFRLLSQNNIDEIYNLAAQSYVGVSFDQPHTTAQATGFGPVNILECIRQINPEIRFYQASTSEMFGKVVEVPQNENTPFYPRSPYGAAKLYAHWMTVNYREAFNIFATSGILFNHESPLRGQEFVTRKISASIARIQAGQQDILKLGNLDAKRDWGYAEDYVEGMWRILQHDTPDTWVLSTGRAISVRDFTQLAFEAAGVTLAWSGQGKQEQGHCVKTGRLLVSVDPDYYRPAEVDSLLGDASAARTQLGWEPKVQVEELVRMMVEADIARLKVGRLN